MNLDFVEAVHLGQQIGVLLKNGPRTHRDRRGPPFVDLPASLRSWTPKDPIGVAAQHVNPNDNGATPARSALDAQAPRVTGLVGHSEPFDVRHGRRGVALTLRASCVRA